MRSGEMQRSASDRVGATRLWRTRDGPDLRSFPQCTRKGCHDT
jgi:hypothetical protein